MNARLAAVVAVTAALIACEEDFDADGFTVSEDCDDHSAFHFPGATELCNGVDENCDDLVDNGDFTPGQQYAGREAVAFYTDWDGDGYGDASTAIVTCGEPAYVGYTGDGTDCDDTRYHVHPTAIEVCGDRDYDCDGLAPPACDPADYPF